MSASAADWTTAIATCVLAIGGVLAGVYAIRTYRAQSAQLDVARRDSIRLRTPVLRAVVDLIDHGGVPKFRLDVWLSTPETLASLRVIIEEARARDCPLGFTPGQNGVSYQTNQDALPPGWPDDPTRREAGWDELLLPGGAATWQMALREHDPGTTADPSKVRIRAECHAAADGKPWTVEVPVTVSNDATGRIGPDRLVQ